MVTAERLHELVDALPEAERETAARVLAALVHAPRAAAVSGAAFFGLALGAPPAVLRAEAPPLRDIRELRGDFWPEDEGPDDFVTAVRAWRREAPRG